MAKAGDVQLEFVPEKSFRAFETGFLQGSNPNAYNRLLAMAVTNAVRTMVKPMKSEAPKRTGRLAGSITAKSGRYSRPSATVGPRPGKSRADAKGGWYRYFVTSGHATRKPTRTAVTSWGDVGRGVPAATNVGTGRVAGNHFVARVSENEGYRQTAMDAYYATIEKFFNDTTFRHRITKFKRKGRR